MVWMVCCQSGLLRIGFVERVAEAVTFIVEELRWIAQMLLIIRTFRPARLRELFRTEEESDLILFHPVDHPVGYVAICRQEVAFMNEKRICIGCGDMADMFSV